MTNKIIWDFINAMEGFSNRGYVPHDNQGNVMGTSGVTIGNGCDLGAIGEEGLTNLNLSDDLFQKLNKYTKYKKEDAVDFLSRFPLTLYQNECDELRIAIEMQQAEAIETMYNNASNVSFADLTAEQQTILTSVFYQYGNLPHRCPKFWQSATTQCWPCVIAILRTFGDHFGTRRNKEADLLENSLK